MAHSLSPPDRVEGIPTADLVTLSEKLRRIPDRVRLFDYDSSWARRYLQIRPALLRRLVEHGFPHRVVDGECRFDRLDLYNCGMQLGQGPATRLARRFWPAALAGAAAGRQARYEMQFMMQCPAPGPNHSCDFTLALPGGEMRTVTLPPGTAAPTVTVHLTQRADWPELPMRAREVLEVTRGLEFMVLHDEIKWDTAFVRRSGLADCAGSSALVAQEARRLGVAARSSFGYVVVPPFAARHSWVDFLVDGVWVPVDSLLIQTMVRWGVLDSGQWSPSRSIGPIVARVGAEEVEVARHDGAPVSYALPVRLLTNRG